MKKRSWIVGIILVAALAITLGVSPVFAHGNTAPSGDETWYPGDHCGAGGMMSGYHMGMLNGETLEQVADTLGLTAEQLEARLEDGKTIAEAAEERGVDTSLVVATLLAPHSEMLQVRVRYGYLTEAEAEYMLEQAQLHIEQLITEYTYGDYGLSNGPSAGYNYDQGWQGHGGMMNGGWGSGMMGSW